MTTRDQSRLRVLLAVVTCATALICVSLEGKAQEPPATSSPDQHVRRLVSLIDYIAGDYTEAVRGGQVVNADEFAEMQDFARGAAHEFAAVKSAFPADAADSVEKQFVSLESLIAAKADAAAIQPVIQGIKARILDRGLVATAPKTYPSASDARRLYGEQCAACHGPNGQGDGPGAQGLTPPPRNFHEHTVMEQSSPFKFFNALELGISGTSMASYADRLSADQRWSLAFYVASLRHGMDRVEEGATLAAKVPAAALEKIKNAGLSLALLSKSADGELKTWLVNTAGLTQAEAETTLPVLRTVAPFDQSVPIEKSASEIAAAAPSKASDNSGASPETATKQAAPSDVSQKVQLALTKVQEARRAFTAGDAPKAETSLFDAYLEGFDPAERLLSLRDKALVTRVEQTFIAARGAARAGDTEKFQSTTQSLEDDLRTSLTLLGEGAAGEKATSWSGFSDFFASLIIILREGFEAFLVVAALLTLIRKTGNHAARKWVHLGWISAIIAGIATFVLFNWVFAVSGATRETVEAVSTGIAAVGLFYVSFWLLNQAERSRWDRYIKASALNVAGAGGNIGAMFFVAFIAVYREAAETVLFYQALVSGASAPAQVVTGLVAGCLVLLAVSGAIIRFGIRLPMRQFFLATSTFMIVISVVLVGKTVNELVNAGYIQPTRMARLPVIDALGIYPVWESVGLQILFVMIAAALAYLSAQKGKRV